MKCYEKYKPSGIEWIGEIPEHWEVKRLKRFAKICNGQDHKSVFDLNGKYPIMGSGGEFGRANTFLHPGPSVLLGRKGTIDKPRYVDFPFWSVDTAYYTDIFSITNPKFFYYLCTTIKFDLYKYGSAVPSMNQEVLGQIEFASPPLTEQFSIASYLDCKTAEIDQIIANKQKLIILYEEEKHAVINKTVNKGLDPNVKLKPSGIEFLDEIPEHWKLNKLKWIMKIKSGDGILAEDIKPEGTYPIYGGNGIMGFTENYNSDADDIIIGRVGAKCGNVRLVSGRKWISDNALFADLNLLFDKKYVTALLKSLDLNNMANQNAQPLITGTMIKEKISVFPPINEQHLIIEHIERESNQLDTRIEKCKNQIKLLKEYRATLINEAVTGKIKPPLNIES